MLRLLTRLLLVLALLGALWHPLCACTGVFDARDAAGEAGCCAPGDPAPRTDPCGQPAGECDCERELVLGSSAGDGATLLRLSAPLFAPTLLPVAVLAPLAAPRAHAARATHAAPLRPPDRCRPLPLRI